jgi:hypothetical protein
MEFTPIIRNVKAMPAHIFMKPERTNL